MDFINTLTQVTIFFIITGVGILTFIKIKNMMQIKIWYVQFMHKRFGSHYILIDDIYQATHVRKIISVPSGILVNHPNHGWKSITRLTKYSMVALTMKQEVLNDVIRLLISDKNKQ